MKRIAGVMLIGTALLSGCGEKTSPPPDPHASAQALSVISPAVQVSPATPSQANPAKQDGMDEVVAKVSGEPITMRQLVDPLIESRGLTMLVNLVELELARQNAAKAQYHITVTAKDFEDEHDRTLEKMFKDSDDAKLLDALDKAITAKDSAEEAKIRAEIKLEREDYLAQFLVNQHIDRVEFDIVLHINTYLRKILESEWKDKITDKDVRAAFGQMYGERLEVHYILLENMTEVAEAQRRLKDGDSFEQVAKDMSHDPRTAPEGGKLEAFSRETTKVPSVFRDTAFALHDGQISDVVAVGSSFMLIKRIRAIPPQAVQLDDGPNARGVMVQGVRPIVYRKLYEALMEAGLKGMKQQLGAEARNEMQIINPVLARQFKENADRQIKAEKKAKDELDLQQHLRDGLKAPPATRPADTQSDSGTAPATGAAPPAPGAAAGERPPATEPGSVHPFALPRLTPDTQPSAVPDANK